ncbi:hypothetical protein SSIN_0621 [Streptococcus sinensis]|uniref:Uncharacterized protein n=1 Tax=Streptococcus sinensis TaxID=176090 RepID=A0A0A0DKR9_9STRE|nr:hypothetical protein SSIN_0621 [Streptococcus sinensis]
MRHQSFQFFIGKFSSFVLENIWPHLMVDQQNLLEETV